MPDASLRLEPLHTLTHNNGVYWAAWSPDGKRLASASLDNTVKLWNPADGAHVGTLKGHGDGVTFVDFLKDGRIVSASLDKTLKLWSAEGELKTTLPGHEQYLSCAAASKTGHLLASGGFDKSVRLYDAAAGASVAIFAGQPDTVQAVAISPDDALVASGGDDHSIRLWNVETKSLRKAFAAHSETVEGLAFSPDGELLVSAGGDGRIRFWALDGEPRGEIATASPRMKCLAWSADGGRLATGGSDGVVRVWSAADRIELAAVSGHKNTVYGVAFSPDGQRLASAGFDRTLRVWNVLSETQPR